MKNIVSILALFLMLNNWAIAQKGNCENKAIFGGQDICLPSMEGYQEAYGEPSVKELADRTEVAANRVLGFYLNQETYENRATALDQGIDDYFKVYGTKQIENLPADQSVLKELQNVLAGNFMEREWDEIKKGIDETGLNIDVGAPTVIKTYNLNENSFTYVMLTKYSLEGQDPFTVAMTISGLLIKDRMVWLAYYLSYEGEETIQQLQKNSDSILTQLLEAN